MVGFLSLCRSQVLLEPLGGETRDSFEGTGLGKQMCSAKHDAQGFFAL